MIQAKEYIIPFVKKVKVANDTYSFYFDRTGTAYDFLPGQYNKIMLPIIASDGRGISRYFTSASCPFDKKYIVVTTKTGISDFKKALFLLQPEQKITLFGPIGGFLLDETITRHVFISGGIGITPFYSMITYAAAKKLPLSIILIASFTTRDTALYEQELYQIARRDASHIKVVYTFTQGSDRDTYENRRVSPSLIKRHIPDFHEYNFSIVGPPQMVEDTEEMLWRMGIGYGKVNAEHFNGY